MDFVNTSTSLEVAKSIQEFFPDTSIDDLESAIERYKSIEAWPATIEFKEESFNHLQDIMINANELDSPAPYSELIYKNE